jgi:hypothetical protein
MVATPMEATRILRGGIPEGWEDDLARSSQTRGHRSHAAARATQPTLVRALS